MDSSAIETKASLLWRLALEGLPRVALALLVLFGFWLLLRTARPLLRRILARANFDKTLIDMLVDGLFKGTVVVVALITAASQLGVNVAAALAGLGVAGIALGFAAQETVANLIAGFLIFWDHPFKIGDFITTQGQSGRVQEITMRTTRIRTMENTYIVIPNKQIIGDMMVNHSMYGETRINVPLGIAYKERIAEAREVLLPVLRSLPGVLAQPAPELVAKSSGIPVWICWRWYGLPTHRNRGPPRLPWSKRAKWRSTVPASKFRSRTCSCSLRTSKNRPCKDFPGSPAPLHDPHPRNR